MLRRIAGAVRGMRMIETKAFYLPCGAAVNDGPRCPSATDAHHARGFTSLRWCVIIKFPSVRMVQAECAITHGLVCFDDGS